MRRRVLLTLPLATSRCCSRGNEIRVDAAPESTDEAVEMRLLQSEFAQSGPFLGSTASDEAQDVTSARTRRAIQRIPQPEVPYSANETSFRRLPQNLRLPPEYELRGLYPQKTGLDIQTGDAHCVDHSALGIDEDAMPIQYSMLTPKGWLRENQYPYMVVLTDFRGVCDDFQDVCANFFERPAHQALMSEQQWVVISPTINMKNNFQIPIEGIVARFCDWVAETFNVENGRVHLFGKGLGAYAALRTCLEHKEVAISVVALLGRNGSPFRPMDRAQEKVKNLNGVHSLVFVPGLLRKQDYFYKFKFMMDLARVRPALRNIHFAHVGDHQVYYAINPIEFWNHMQFFRQYNVKMLTESGVPL